MSFRSSRTALSYLYSRIAHIQSFFVALFHRVIFNAYIILSKHALYAYPIAQHRLVWTLTFRFNSNLAYEFKYLATAPLNFLPLSPATLMMFSRSSPAVMPIFLIKSFATVSKSSPPMPSGISSSGRPKYALLDIDVAPSKPCRRVLASV